MSASSAAIENMFEVRLPDLDALRGLDDAGLVDTMRDAARLESAATARKFAAAAQLYQRRLAEQDAEDREQWCIDGWEQVAAAVAAAQGISRGRAAGQLRYGLALAERLPKLGASFASGDVDFRVISAAVFRTCTELMTDDNAVTRLDGWLALQRFALEPTVSSEDRRNPRLLDTKVGTGRGADGAGDRGESPHRHRAAAFRDGRDLG